MSETERSSVDTTVRVEDLLKLKRAEKPSNEFWVRFDQDLQQKQLQALLRPSLWSRTWSRFQTPRESWRAITAVVGGGAAIAICVFSFLITFDYFEAPSDEIAGKTDVEVQQVVSAETEIVKETKIEETVVRSGGAFFVVDALRPDETSFETFRMVANPETWTDGRGNSASYAVNTFTTRGDYLSGTELTIDF
ncbi:MAG TPA: hypothetical protein VK041_05150 [Opitutales bacterium]|nr:hypothetical protein [Opitutales bacterium]